MTQAYFYITHQTEKPIHFNYEHSNPKGTCAKFKHKAIPIHQTHTQINYLFRWWPDLKHHTEIARSRFTYFAFLEQAAVAVSCNDRLAGGCGRDIFSEFELTDCNLVLALLCDWIVVGLWFLGLLMIDRIEELLMGYIYRLFI